MGLHDFWRGFAKWKSINSTRVRTQWRTDWQDNSMIGLGSDRNAMLSFNVDNDHFQVALCPPPSSRHFPRKTVDMVESELQRYSRWLPWKLQPIWAPLFFADIFTGFSWGSVYFCTKQTTLSSLAARKVPKGRSPKRKFQFREDFFWGAAISSLPIR